MKEYYKTKRFAILEVLILVFGFVFLATEVFASGIRVYPSHINFESEKGRASFQKIFIENNSKESLQFEVKTEKSEGWIAIKEQSFNLTQGEKKEVEILISSNESGVLADNILVVAKQTGNSSVLKANIGVKIPVEISVKQGMLGNLSADILNFFDKGIKIKYLALALFGIIIIWIFLPYLLNKRGLK